ncbi:hypothetical protein D3C73_1267940 [compost metagenome]
MKIITGFRSVNSDQSYLDLFAFPVYTPESVSIGNLGDLIFAFGYTLVIPQGSTCKGRERLRLFFLFGFTSEKKS